MRRSHHEFDLNYRVSAFTTWSSSELAVQSKLGLLAQRRHWANPIDSSNSLSAGKSLVLGVRRPDGALVLRRRD